MPELKIQEYLGQWIPISKWVQAMDSKGMDTLTLIRARLQAQGIGAEIALSKGNCCVYREVTERDINVVGDGSREWLRSIQTHAVKNVSDAKYAREHKPRKTK